MKYMLFAILLLWTTKLFAFGFSPALLDVSTVQKGELFEGCFWLSSEVEDVFELKWNDLPEAFELSEPKKRYHVLPGESSCLPIRVDTAFMKSGGQSQKIMIQRVANPREALSIYPAIALEFFVNIVEAGEPKVQVLSLQSTGLDLMNTGAVNLKNLRFEWQNMEGVWSAQELGGLGLRKILNFSLSSDFVKASSQAYRIYEGDFLLHEEVLNSSLNKEEASFKKIGIYGGLFLALAIIILHFIWYRL